MLRGLVVRGGDRSRREPRPAFRPLRRPRDQSDPGAGADHRRICTTRTARSRFRASTTASRNCPRRSPNNGAISASTPTDFLGDVGLSTPAGEKDRSVAGDSSGRGRPATSTASSAAIRARAPRPCCPPRPARSSRSASSASRIPERISQSVSRIREVAPAARREGGIHRSRRRAGAIAPAGRDEALRRARAGARSGMGQARRARGLRRRRSRSSAPSSGSSAWTP